MVAAERCSLPRRLTGARGFASLLAALAFSFALPARRAPFLLPSALLFAPALLSLGALGLALLVSTLTVLPALRVAFIFRSPVSLTLLTGALLALRAALLILTAALPAASLLVLITAAVLLIAVGLILILIHCFSWVVA